MYWTELKFTFPSHNPVKTHCDFVLVHENWTFWGCTLTLHGHIFHGWRHERAGELTSSYNPAHLRLLMNLWFIVWFKRLVFWLLFILYGMREYCKPNVNGHKVDQKILLNIFFTKFKTIQTKLGLFFILSTLKHMFFRNEYYLIAFDKWQVGPFLFV